MGKAPIPPVRLRYRRRVTTGAFELDYADMQGTADGFHAVAADLRACLLGPVPEGVGVYGYPVLADAVARLAEALRARHTAATDAAETVGDLLELCLRGYRLVDEASAALLEARLRILDALSPGASAPVAPAGSVRPV